MGKKSDEPDEIDSDWEALSLRAALGKEGAKKLIEDGLDAVWCGKCKTYHQKGAHTK